jgi:GT2 family glycosyltransferase
MNDSPFVSALIVNYNSGAYAVRCIDTLLLQKNIRLEIIVIDNASKDNSVTLLKSTFNDRIKLISGKSNLGFGCANNAVAAFAQGDFLLLINPDTEIYDELFIFKLVSKLKKNKETGLIAPSICEPRKNNKIIEPKYRYPGVTKLIYSKEIKNLPGQIAWVLGACMLMKASVYKEIGGFDEDYFLYGEDVDICIRLRKHGYTISYAADLEIMHVSAVSEIGSNNLEKWLRKRRGLFLFYSKHYDLRDVERIAKITIIVSSVKLLLFKMINFLNRRQSDKLLDKVDRLKASLEVAKKYI